LLVECGSCNNVFKISLNNYQKSITGKCYDCNGNSSAEAFISDYLRSHNIEFQERLSFQDCKDVNVLPFDFYIPSKNLIIEFDGPHHYRMVYTLDSYIKTQKHDKMKNQYCDKKAIRLLRIPYWEYKNIEIILDKYVLGKFPLFTYH
jgi:very-short-patch-repair endonuclease